MTPRELTLTWTDGRDVRHELHLEATVRSGRWMLARRHFDPEGSVGRRHQRAVTMHSFTHPLTHFRVIRSDTPVDEIDPTGAGSRDSFENQHEITANAQKIHNWN